MSEPTLNVHSGVAPEWTKVASFRLGPIGPEEANSFLAHVRGLIEGSPASLTLENVHDLKIPSNKGLEPSDVVSFINRLLL